MTMTRETKARKVRSLRDRLDHALFMARSGQRPAPGYVDRLQDQLDALAALEPPITLQDVAMARRLDTP